MTRKVVSKAVDRLPDEFTIYDLLEKLMFVEGMEEEMKSLREQGLLPDNKVED